MQSATGLGETPEWTDREGDRVVHTGGNTVRPVRRRAVGRARDRRENGAIRVVDTTPNLTPYEREFVRRFGDHDNCPLGRLARAMLRKARRR